MSTKVRLVGGPFGGKVMDHPATGRNEIVIQGPKKMTSKQKWEWMEDQYKIHGYRPHFDNNGAYTISGLYPRVEARYRVAVRPHYGYNYHSGTDFYGANIACMHPDGSLFYEYVEGSKREC